MPLIPGDNIVAICTVIFALTWLGFWIDTLEIGRKISGVIWVLCLGMLLSNFQIIPFKSPIYDFVGSTLVPLAIPLLLLKSNLRKIFKESGKVMLIFCFASLTTVFGAVLGFYIFDLGEIGPKVAGVYSSGYIGGAVNFLAVSQVVEMTSTEFSTAISASSIVSILGLLALFAIPSTLWITRHFPSFKDQQSADENKVSNDDVKPVTFKLTHLTGVLSLSFTICAVSQYLATLIGIKQYTFLIITAITILVANLFPKQINAIEGEFEMGLLLMYLFFAVVGAGTDMSAFLGSAIVLFIYGMFIIITHLTITLFLAKYLKLDLKETIIASAAALVGPAVTAAIATCRGWRNLVTPGIMCGIFGYAIASFIGVTITELLK